MKHINALSVSYSCDFNLRLWYAAVDHPCREGLLLRTPGTQCRAGIAPAAACC